MKSKECKIVCSGKDVATVNCTKNGCNIEYTEYGKKLSKEFLKEGFEGCC